jgi:carboxylesterase type B
MNQTLKIFLLLFCVLAGFTGSTFLAGKNINATKVQTESGFVSGTTTSDGIVKIFMGIPFAAPPGVPNYGAFHSAEFGYALHNLDKWDRPFTETDRRLENTMSSYWVNFARTGNPNGPGLPDWPAFDNKSPCVSELGDDVKSIPLPLLNQLHFFDNLNK